MGKIIRIPDCISCPYLYLKPFHKGVWQCRHKSFEGLSYPELPITTPYRKQLKTLPVWCPLENEVETDV